MLELALLAQQAASGSLVPLLVQGSTIGAVVTAFGLLHRSAVAAERRRADDWRAAARAAEDRANERDRQLWTVLSAVPDKAGAA